jgi:hypothetical protein
LLTLAQRATRSRRCLSSLGRRTGGQPGGGVRVRGCGWFRGGERRSCLYRPVDLRGTWLNRSGSSGGAVPR